MTQQEKDFMEQNINNYHTIQSGYVRNLDISILLQYETIYKKYLDANFVLTKWCSDCVFDTLKRLYSYYLSLPQEEIQSLDTFVFHDDLDKIVPNDDSVVENLIVDTKRRGRPKQNK